MIRVPDIPMPELTDEQWAIADRVAEILDSNPCESFTPSGMARAARATYGDTAAVLTYLAANRFADTVGNGAHTRYTHRPR